MSVYPICSECGTRRETCLSPVAHKKYVKWTADVHFSRTEGRRRKNFSTKELADIQARQWQTDYERGLLLPSEKRAQLPFPDVAEEWLQSVIKQNRILDPERSEKYRVAMFQKLFAKKSINALVFQDGEDWIDSRIDEGKAVATINRDFKTLTWIMNYAVKKGYIKDNPFSELKELKGANIRVRWMSEQEIPLLIDAIRKLQIVQVPNQHDSTGYNQMIDFVEIGLNTGFRKGNLERLAGINITHNRITAVKTKSRKPYDVPIAPCIVPTLQRLIASHPTGPLLNIDRLDYKFREATKLAGLYTKKGDPNNVTIHTLRHTFAALYLKRGGDIYILSKLLGHSSVTVTEKVYGHLCPRKLDAQAPLISTNVRAEESSYDRTRNEKQNTEIL